MSKTASKSTSKAAPAQAKAAVKASAAVVTPKAPAGKPVAPAPKKPASKAAPPVAPTSSKSKPAPTKSVVVAVPPPAPTVAAKKKSSVSPAPAVAQKASPAPSLPTASTPAAAPPAARPAPLPMDIVKPAVKVDPKLANAWKTKAGRDLTDPELMAMPEAEYMNDKQLEFFRVRLQTLKDDLISNAGETTEHLREDTTIVPDPADRATIEEEHALELRTRDRERKLLKKISQSLMRIDSGDYGYCDETGEPIGLGRLLARPTATYSLEAQQRREMKQKMFGD